MPEPFYSETPNLYFRNTKPDSIITEAQDLPRENPNLFLPRQAGIVLVQEVLKTPEPVFPEFNGDLTSWNRDITVLEEALKHPQGYKYQAQLPDIIGYLNPQEAKIVDNWGVIDNSYSDEEGSDKLDVIRQILPNMMETIEDDVYTITSGRGYIRFVEWEKYHTAKGEIAKGNGELHVDNMIRKQEDVLTTHYLLADLEPTIIYSGTAKLFQLRGRGELRVDTDSLETNRPFATVAIPPYAIVRTNGTTVHASPRFKEAGTRAWMRATTGLR